MGHRRGLLARWAPAVIRDVERRLAAVEAGDAAARRVLLDAVAARLAAAGVPDGRVLTAVEALGEPGGTVRGAAERAGLSARQLRRRLIDEAGMGPAELRGVLRFAAFLRWCDDHGLRPRSLARAAAECGYADQAHLARACRTLAGAPASGIANARRAAA